MRVDLTNSFETGTITCTNLTAFPALKIVVDANTRPNPQLGIRLKALKANTGIIYIGNDNTGYPMSPGDEVFLQLNSFTALTFFPGTNGDKISYLVL